MRTGGRDKKAHMYFGLNSSTHPLAKFLAECFGAEPKRPARYNIFMGHARKTSCRLSTTTAVQANNIRNKNTELNIRFTHLIFVESGNTVTMCVCGDVEKTQNRFLIGTEKKIFFNNSHNFKTKIPTNDGSDWATFENPIGIRRLSVSSCAGRPRSETEPL